MNPILPEEHFVPDAEAHVMPDGRLYLYGSYDLSGNSSFCSDIYHVFSTSDPELKEWTDHGVSFENSKEKPGIPWKPGVTLYAPDAAFYRGRYYLFICGSDNFEAVASSDKPEGPFTGARPVEGADGDSIDPAVFVDTDGSAYLLWGQFRLRGARLNEDLTGIVPETYTENILTEMEHGFHEGSSLRKIGNRYYIVYADISRGRPTCLSYAVSDHPLGPYKKGGVIIDNTFCDPETWNNHGSIEYFQGRWFVFYHRSSQNGATCRRVCAEPIEIRPDGSIPEVTMSSQGAQPSLNALEWIEARCAARTRKAGYIAPDPETGHEVLTGFGNSNWIEDWAEYTGLNLGTGVRRVRILGAGHGTFALEGSGGKRLGECAVDSDTITECVMELREQAAGIQTLYLLMKGDSFRVWKFRFEA